MELKSLALFISRYNICNNVQFLCYQYWKMKAQGYYLYLVLKMFLIVSLKMLNLLKLQQDFNLQATNMHQCCSVSDVQCFWFCITFCIICYYWFLFCNSAHGVDLFNKDILLLLLPLTVFNYVDEQLVVI